MIINTICICGAGAMGSGIAQVAAQHGFTTIQFDIDASMLDKSRQTIDKNFQFLVDKGKMSADEKAGALNQLRFTNDINACVADVIIEAIAEDISAKVNLFNQLAAINKSSTVLASNTSSLSINKIAGGIKNPERVAGMHFFNPAYVMKLVEVVKGEQTSDEVSNAVYQLAIRMGKTPVFCNDAPGFIVNRVARPYYLEAMKLVESGLATPEDIDELMEATGFKMGPFKLMDLIGIDINYKVSEIVWEALGKPARLQPSTLQKEKVHDGALGRKTGKGFYDY
jgi:3-hydroxybutyryl-CoA dehydrogenase